MPINIDGSKGIRQNTTEVTKIPVGTTAQRPANADAGMIRFNTDEGRVEGYNDRIDEWQPINQLFQKLAATGGTVTDITQDGQLFRVHTFTSDGTFEVTAGGDEVEYLVVAGGGGGGGDQAVTTTNWFSGSGAGAGGLLAGTTTVTSQTYNIIVGNGGLGAVNNVDLSGEQGENSSAFGLTAIGGGPGVTVRAFDQGLPDNGADGGSGGGRDGQSKDVGGDAGRPGEGTPGQGNSGSDSVQNEVSGAGGGAGGPGIDATATLGGFGGPGIASNINGSVQFYAGGGGGGVRLNQNHGQGLGGIGGGGDGSPFHGSGSVPGSNGAPNTGGGAGGSGASTGDTENRTRAANGGAGIVLIRYRIG